MAEKPETSTEEKAKDLCNTKVQCDEQKSKKSPDTTNDLAQEMAEEPTSTKERPNEISTTTRVVIQAHGNKAHTSTIATSVHNKTQSEKILIPEDKVDFSDDEPTDHYEHVANISAVELIACASAGLALRGVLLTGNATDFFKDRATVLNPPEKIRLLNPSLSETDKSKSYSKQSVRNSCTHLIEEFGAAVGIGGSVSVPLVSSLSFSGHVMGDSSKYTGSYQQDDSSDKETFQERSRTIPTATIDLDPKSAGLTEQVVTELQGIEKILDSKSSRKFKQDRCNEFLWRYGSHVKSGFLHFGGVYHELINTSSGSTLNIKSDVKSLLNSGHVELGPGFRIAKVFAYEEGEKTMANIENTRREFDNSNKTTSKTKQGGPPGNMSYKSWCGSLRKSNKNWAVIDRGNDIRKDFIPIWKLIRNCSDLFIDADNLSNNLEQAWLQMARLCPDKDIEESIAKRERQLQDRIWLSYSEIEYQVKKWMEDPSFEDNKTCYLLQLQKTLQDDYQTTVPDIISHSSVIRRFIMRISQHGRCSEGKSISYSISQDQPLCMETDLSEWTIISETDNDEILYNDLDKSEVKNNEGTQNIQKAGPPPNEIVLTKYEFLDVPSMVSAIKCELLESANLTSDLISKNLKYGVKKMSAELEKRREYLQLLFLRSITICIHDTKGCKDTISLLRLEQFVSSAEHHWKEYQQYQFQGLRQLEAYVINLLLEELRGSDASNMAMNNVFKSKIFDIQEHLTLYKTVLSAFCECSHSLPISTLQWDKISKDLKRIMKEAYHIGFLEESTILVSENMIPNSSLAKQTAPELCSAAGELLERLSLSQHFPDKLTLQGATSVRNIEQKHAEKSYVEIHDTEKNLPRNILEGLLALDCNARDKHIEKLYAYENEDSDTDSDTQSGYESETDQEQLNPLDVFMATFSCCDLLLKQALLQRLFLCKLAIPLMYRNIVDNKLVFSIWGLRTIRPEYRRDAQVVVEQALIDEPANIVSFVRFGRPQFSKSKMLNTVINGQGHHTFVNVDSPNGVADKIITDGLIEATWFLPGDSVSDAFNEMTMFINLRGDALLLEEQLKVISKLSSTIVIVLDVQCLDDVMMLAKLNSLKTDSATVLLLLTSNGTTEKKADLIKYKKIVPGLNKIFSFKSDRLKTQDEMKIEVRKSIKRSLQTATARALTNLVMSIRELKIKIDEDDHSCSNGERMANDVVRHMKRTPKKTMMPLQTTVWLQVVDKLRQLHAPEGLTKLPDQRLKLEDELVSIRKKGLEMSKYLHPAIACFIDSLHNCLKSRERMDLLMFLKWLMFKLSEINVSNSVEHDDEKHIELQDFLRELGQIYEVAVESKESIDSKSKIMVNAIPDMAAQILKEGQCMELMNGVLDTLPLTWVKAMFNSLDKIIPDKRIFVVSVLGVQGSGKSTLLNTMFGLEFPVGEGRCTRGAYMQFVEVEQKKSEFPYDYVLIVDSEGIGSAETCTDDHLHDNRIAALVIGLGDVTIMNVNGSILTEADKNVLQTVIHAFVRMKKVNVNLRNACIFTHQRVEALSAKSRNEVGLRETCKVLDEQTREVCAIEKMPGTLTFSEVIHFNKDTNVWYISNLWRGDPPMAPVNPGYSEKVSQVRQLLLGEVSNTIGSFLNVSYLMLHIDGLWKGIESETFVCSFQNTLELELYEKLETKCRELKLKIDGGITWVKSNALVKLKHCKSNTQLITMSSDLNKELQNRSDHEVASASKSLDEFYNKDNVKSILDRWKATTLQEIVKYADIVKMEALEEILECQHDCNSALKERVNYERYQNDITIKAEQLADTMRGKDIKDSDLESKFEESWNMWNMIDHSQTHDPDMRGIPEEFETALCSICPKRYRDSLSKFLENEPCRKPKYHLIDSITTTDIPAKNRFFKAVSPCFSQLNQEQIIDHFNELFSCITVHVDKLSSQHSPFRPHHAREVVKYIIETCDPIAPHVNEHFVRIAVYTCQYAVLKFETMDETYRQTQTMEARQENFKSYILKYFKDMVRDRETHIVVSDQLLAGLEEAMRTIIMDKLSQQIINYSISLFEKGKRNLLQQILSDLAKNDSFREYIVFLMDAENYAERWLTSFIQADFFESDGTQDSKYVEFATSHIEKNKNIIISGIRTATENVPDDSTHKMNQWCEEFCNLMVKNHITVPKETINLIQKVHVGNLKELKKYLDQDLDNKLKENIITSLKERGAEIRWHGKSPYRASIEKMWGCREKCPFCNEPYARSDKHPGIDHHCLQHRPVGIIGMVHGKEGDGQNIVLDTCSTLVSSNKMFNCVGCKHECKKGNKCPVDKPENLHPWKEWSEYVPGWKISDSALNQSEKYWAWVIANHVQDLKDLHNVSNIAVHPEWNTITKEEAIESLKSL